jgi:hypothetical protein
VSPIQSRTRWLAGSWIAESGRSTRIAALHEPSRSFQPPSGNYCSSGGLIQRGRREASYIVSGGSRTIYTPERSFATLLTLLNTTVHFIPLVLLSLHPLLCRSPVFPALALSLLSPSPQLCGRFLEIASWSLVPTSDGLSRK